MYTSQKNNKKQKVNSKKQLFTLTKSSDCNPDHFNLKLNLKVREVGRMEINTHVFKQN